MYLLPRTLPADVRALLEKQLEDLPLEDALRAVSGVVLRLFNAREALFFLHHAPFDRPRRNVLRLHSSTREASDPGFGERLLDAWCEKGIDEGVTKALAERLSCISYSAFSWPFGRFSLEAEFSLPQDYTILLPVSSALSVRHDSEPEFIGYFALFFPSFPQLTENLVQLITQLPDSLSNLVFGYLRGDRRSESEELGAFAHDMKQSLLLAEEQICRLRNASPEQVVESLGRLERNVKRMVHQASAVLLADRVQFENFRISSLPMCINEVVHEAIADYEPQLAHSKVELRIELADDLPLSQIDPAVFPTVIGNLLENSIKYSSDKACIYLRTKQSGADRVRLEVMDNGCGIPESEWEKIFLKHYRGTGVEGLQGNGLGLYLVKKIVEAHNGTVFPEKTPDMSTCFVIELPTVEQEDA